MVVSVLYLRIELDGIYSLKEKRSVISSLKDRAQNKFKLSIAEVGANDMWHVAEIACSIVSNSHVFGEKVLQKVAGFIDETVDFPIQTQHIFSEHY